MTCRRQVAGGQGTIAIELLDQVRDLGTVYVPVGGGGLISGIAAVLRGSNRGIRVVGCQPEASAVMMQSVRAGKIIGAPSLQTLSDGTAGDSAAGVLCPLLWQTLRVCRRLKAGEQQPVMPLFRVHPRIAAVNSSALPQAALRRAP